MNNEGHQQRSSKMNERCENCKWRKPDNTCKESPREATDDHDWCTAFKQKVMK